MKRLCQGRLRSPPAPSLITRIGYKACFRVRDADGRLTTKSIAKVHETYDVCV